MNIPEDADRIEGAESEAAGSISPLEIVQFVFRAARRHRRLGIWVAASVAVVGVVLVLLLPSKYYVQSRILAVQSAAVAALTNTEGRSTGSPFAGDAELLLQKSNLEWIIQEASLVETWRVNRSAPLRAKDWVTERFVGPLTDADVTKGLVEMLRNAIYVTSDPSVLNIHVQWQSPDIAVKIGQLAQARFFSLKKTQELSATTATITLCENELRRLSDTIDESLAELVRLREERKAKTATGSGQVIDEVPATADAKTPRTPAAIGVRKSPNVPPVVAQPRSAARASAPAAAPAPKLAAQLAELRQKERDIEGPWQRRLAELKYQLTDIRVTYGPEHPVVLQQEAKIRDAINPPVELIELRQKEQQLLTEIESLNREAEAADAEQPARQQAVGQYRVPAGPSANTSRSGAGTVVITEREDDPILAPAKAKLQTAITSYGDASKRLERAQTQLAASQVALQFKYVVVAEPELPRKPAKPNKPLLLLGALAAAVLVGGLAGALRDLLSGRVFEPWQARQIGLQVLGEVELSKHTKS